MNLMRINTMPSTFNRMDNMIDNFFNSYTYEDVWVPNYTILDNEDAYKILMEIPGIEKKNVTLEYKAQILTISGKREVQERDDAYYDNFQYGNFSKQFRIPDDIVDKNISGELKNGVLEITIPKKVKIEPKAKRITVK